MGPFESHGDPGAFVEDARRFQRDPRELSEQRRGRRGDYLCHVRREDQLTHGATAVGNLGFLGSKFKIIKM